MKITIIQQDKKKRTIETQFDDGDVVAHLSSSLNTDSSYYGIVLDVMVSFKYGITKYLVSFPGTTGEYLEDELCPVKLEEEKQVGFQAKPDEQK